MANLIYLAGAMVLSAVLCGALWFRNRQPRSMQYGIDSFRRELQALAPRERLEGKKRRSG